MTTEPAQRVLDAFDAVTGDARTAVAEALMAEKAPLLVGIGGALLQPAELAVLTVDWALGRARHDGSAGLVGRLGDSGPWGVLRAALAEALEYDGSEIEIASDEC